MDASSWRIADPVFAPFARAYPASMVAALTSYWVTHTRILPGFEFALPRACLRERFEDLNGAQHETIQKVTAFLGFPSIKDQPSPGEGSQPQPAQECSGPQADLPVELIPSRTLAQANDLLG